MYATRREMAWVHATSGTGCSQHADGGTGKVLIVLVGPMTSLGRYGRKKTERKSTAAHPRPNRDNHLCGHMVHMVTYGLDRSREVLPLP
jgi:hypothetical protein